MIAFGEFEIRVQVYGPGTEREYSGGTRVDRDQVASLDVPVDELVAWRIFQDVITQATTPKLVVERTP